MNSSEQNIIRYDLEVYNNVYEIVKSLLSGIYIADSNWFIILHKVLKVINDIKTLNDEEKIFLSKDIILNYLDENTNISDNTFKYIEHNLLFLINFLNRNANINKLNHKKNNSRHNLIYDYNNKKIVNTIYIINSITNNMLLIIKDKKLTISDLETELPEIILESLILIDKYKNLTSKEKVQIINQCMINVLNNDYITNNISETEAELLDLLAFNLPILTETILDTINGDIDFAKSFNTFFTKIKTFFQKCKPCN